MFFYIHSKNEEEITNKAQSRKLNSRIIPKKLNNTAHKYLRILIAGQLNPPIPSLHICISLVCSLGDAVFDSLPPGPAGPQAVPAATEADFDSLPPGPAGPQAVPVGIPPGPAGPQAVPVQQFTTTTSSPAHSTPPPSSAPSTPVPQHTQQVVGAGHQVRQPNTI